MLDNSFLDIFVKIKILKNDHSMDYTIQIYSFQTDKKAMNERKLGVKTNVYRD